MKALIIDDEPMAAKHLKSLVEQHCFEIYSTEMIHSPVEAIDHLASFSYDIIFLDVEMPEIDGFALLEQVELPPTTQVIFTTAYSKYAIDAFKANAAHYLLKMVKKDELITSVRKVTRLLNLTARAGQPMQDPVKVIPIFHNEEHHLVKWEDIVRIEASGSYSRIVLSDKELLSSKGIGHYEKKLENGPFFRCHNSHLVNLREVARLGKGKGGYLVLSNGDAVPLSPSRREAFERRMQL